MKRAAAGLVAALAALGACGGPQPPWPKPPDLALDLAAALSATKVPLFGSVELRLDLWHRQDVAVQFAPSVPGPDFRGEVAPDPVRPFGDGVWQRFRLRLSPVRGPGTLVIAPFRARSADGTLTASTPELKLEVESLLAGAAPALEAPGPPFPPRARVWPYVAGAAALLLLLLGRSLWRRRPRAPAPPVVLEPPHFRALRELTRLGKQPRRTPAEIDAFYVAISQVLRVYLEERFGLRAPERTTEEFLQELEGGGPLSTAQCRQLQRFLHQCDLVKFAALVPAEAVHLETLGAAAALVEETRPDRAPAEAPA